MKGADPRGSRGSAPGQDDRGASVARGGLARVLWVAPTTALLVGLGYVGLEVDSSSIAVAVAVTVFVALQTRNVVRSEAAVVDQDEVVVVPAALVVDPILAGAAHGLAKLAFLARGRPYRVVFTVATTALITGVAGFAGQAVLERGDAPLDAGGAVVLVTAVAVAHLIVIAGTTLATAGAAWLESGSVRVAAATATASFGSLPQVIVGVSAGAVGTEMLRTSLAGGVLYVLAIAGVTTMTNRQLRQEVELATERTRRAEALDALVSAGERERVELMEWIHDGPMQDLVVASMLLEDGRDDPDIPSELLEPVGDALGRAVASLRSVLSGSEAALALTGLGPALESLVASMTPPSGTDLHVTTALPAGLGVAGSRDAVGASALLAGAREALNNAMRHARATTIEVTAELIGDVLRVTVTDDGLGFDPDVVLPARRHEGHLGMVLMDERMTRLGGRVEIDAEPGSGASIALVVPRA